jgi:hypothetical protein
VLDFAPETAHALLPPASCSSGSSSISSPSSLAVLEGAAYCRCTSSMPFGRCSGRSAPARTSKRAPGALANVTASTRASERTDRTVLGKELACGIRSHGLGEEVRRELERPALAHLPHHDAVVVANVARRELGLHAIKLHISNRRMRTGRLRAYRQRPRLPPLTLRGACTRSAARTTSC